MLKRFCEKFGSLIFKILNAVLFGITLLGFYILLFKQLPENDVHYGYGVMFFSMLLAPLVIFPLLVVSLIGASNFYEDYKKQSPFYLTCLVTAILGLLLAIALLAIEDLYHFINLNPQPR